MGSQNQVGVERKARSGRDRVVDCDDCRNGAAF